jgi:hypothetical protein
VFVAACASVGATTGRLVRLNLAIHGVIAPFIAIEPIHLPRDGVLGA